MSNPPLYYEARDSSRAGLFARIPGSARLWRAAGGRWIAGCTLEACAPRNPGDLRVSAVNSFWREETSLRRPTAVDEEGAARDEGRRIRSQEERRPGDIPELTPSSHRNFLDKGLVLRGITQKLLVHVSA